MNKTEKEQIKTKAKQDLKEVNKILKGVQDGDSVVVRTYSKSEMKKRVEARAIKLVDYEDGLNSEVKYGSVVRLRVGMGNVLFDSNDNEYLPEVDIKRINKIHLPEIVTLKDEWGYEVELAEVTYNGSIRTKDKLVTRGDSLRLAKTIMKKQGYKIEG